MSRVEGLTARAIALEIMAWVYVVWWLGSCWAGSCRPIRRAWVCRHGVPSGFDAGDVRGRVVQRREVPQSVPVRLRCRSPFMVTSKTQCNGFSITQRPRTACRNRCGENPALMMWWRIPVAVPVPVPRMATIFPTAASPGRQCRPRSRSMSWAPSAMRESCARLILTGSEHKPQAASVPKPYILCGEYTHEPIFFCNWRDNS